MPENFDVIIIGAGASGLMCAVEAGHRGRKVLVIDHYEKPGQKLLITGGGRCNFTNRQVGADHYLSGIPMFCKSALSRFSPQDFIAVLDQNRIAYSERAHGQLFCNGSAREILNFLVNECSKNAVQLRSGCTIKQIQHVADPQAFKLLTSKGEITCKALVVATGGLSYPEIGASPFGLQIAQQFGLQVVPTAPGLVPFTLNPEDKERLKNLPGIAVEAIVSFKQHSFRENVLFTHRGLSGPAILQISSYWQPGCEISINMLPDVDLVEVFVVQARERPLVRVKTVVADYLPKRLVEAFIPSALAEKALAKTGLANFKKIAALIQVWKIKPAGTEGYRTAEVTLGGVDCREISSKTFAAHKVPGLYFIGEVLDVTGWLGGYNLQWAWSSGWCAGQFV